MVSRMLANAKRMRLIMPHARPAKICRIPMRISKLALASQAAIMIYRIVVIVLLGKFLITKKKFFARL